VIDYDSGGLTSRISALCFHLSVLCVSRRQEARILEWPDSVTESVRCAVRYGTRNALPIRHAVASAVTDSNLEVCRFDKREGWLLVQHDVQERSVDLKTTVVFDEAQFPEFVHEKIDS